MTRLVLALALAIPAAAQPTQIGQSTVYRSPHRDPYDPANRTGFNHAPNVALLPDGRLLAVWFSGPFEASVHQLILGSHSADQGRTWSPAQTMNDFPRVSDFDPALVVDGRRAWLFFSAGRWNRYPFVADEKNRVGERSFQIWQRTSDDSGRTWSEPAAAQVERQFACRNNGIRLTTGELLLPLAKVRGEESGVLKSKDGGKTWRRFGAVHTPQGQEEPAIVELSSGDVLMVLRTGGGVLWKTVSRDKGETWPEPEKTSLVAARSSHSLFRAADGRIVLTRNESPGVRTPITLRVSHDDARTWGEPLTVASVVTPDEHGVRRQVSYPSVAQLPDRTLVAVWADIGVSDTAQWGDIRCARVRLP